MAGEEQERRVIVYRQEKGKKKIKFLGDIVGVEGTKVRIKIDQEGTERAKALEEFANEATPKKTHHSKAFRRYYNG